jgi:hypothetical protein
VVSVWGWSFAMTQPPLLTPPSPLMGAPRPLAPLPRLQCTNCGVIQSVRAACLECGHTGFTAAHS